MSVTLYILNLDTSYLVLFTDACMFTSFFCFVSASLSKVNMKHSTQAVKYK